jgi:EAL domain-containing protein (putative c-di-GMP-specific phosphodiesterase class I)
MADVGVAGPGGEGRSVPRRAWSRRLEEALRSDLFDLHAQPIVDVATGTTVRHELFLRLTDGDGEIPAGEFLFAAEQAGSIREIDRWVVERAVELAGDGHAVAINLSVRSVDDQLLQTIGTALETSGADPHRLVLELKEAQLLRAPRVRDRFVPAVRELGCGVALDGYLTRDGGQGWIRALPIDFVKLGGTLVERLVDDGRRRRKARNAAIRAHQADRRVVAQGVEDLITLQLLPELGIDEAQGYALGAPESLGSTLLGSD